MKSTLFVAALATVVLFWLTEIPLGVPGEWTWERIELDQGTAIDAVLGWLAALVPAVVYLAVAAFGARAIEAAAPKRMILWLGGLVLTGFFWVGVVQDSPVGEYRTQKYPWVLYYPGTEGYFFVARYEMTSTGEFLATYEQRMAAGDVLHVGTHPPGLFLFHRGLIWLCEQSPGLVELLRWIEPPPVAAGFGTIEENSRGRPTELDPAGRAAVWLAALLTQLAAVATLVPLYLLLRRHWSRRTSWRAAAFWPLVPALAVFLPKSDALYPILGVLLVWLWLEGWSRQSLLACAAAGLVLWVGLFFSLALLPVALLCGLLTIYETWIVRPVTADKSAAAPVRLSRRRWLCIAAGAAGVLLPVGLVWLCADLNLFAVWAWNYRNHAAFYGQFERTYWKWLLVNPLEFALAAGLPVMVLVAASYARLRRGAAPWRLDGRSPSAGPLWCCAVVWALLWLSGKNMGEAARLWLIMMPWPVWLTAAAVDGDDPKPKVATGDDAGRLWLLALALQLFVGVATVTRVFGFHYANL